VIVRPRITRGSIISGPALFNYVSQTNAPPRRAQVANDAVVLSMKTAESRAWATVNKLTGGGKKSGSGRKKRK
jgi:hypothetical protein